MRLPKRLLGATVVAVGGRGGTPSGADRAIEPPKSGTRSTANVRWVKDQRHADGTYPSLQGTNVTRVTL